MQFVTKHYVSVTPPLHDACATQLANPVVLCATAATIHPREASSILDTLTPNTYPAKEAAWLLTTCWNWGLHFRRFGRDYECAEYVQVALALLASCPEYQDKSKIMQGVLQDVQARQGVTSVGVAAGS